VGVRAPFDVASFNTLGDSHTSAHGDKPAFPDGVTRMHWDVAFILRNRLDLVGFQELQHPQAQAFAQDMAGRYELFSGSSDTENSIAWNAQRFTLVAGTTQRVPYFSGNIRHMPVVLLRDRSTGQELYVMNVHNPADTRAHHGNEKWRRRAMSRELALVKELRTHGLPVIVTGDMNEHRQGFCTFTSTGDLHAAAGGDHTGGCRAPSGFNGIDWIFGSTGVNFSDFHVDRSTLDSHASDHGVPIARVS
jgi:endonuclease/exonuclease/phosphatase family metal-dependent hydrolase